MHSRHWSFSAQIAAVFVAAAAMVASCDAEAQNAKKSTAGGSASLITGSSFDAMMTALDNNGFRVKLSMDKDGDPLFESTDDDEPFTIHFYGCSAGKDCQYIQFEEGWDLKNGTTPDVIAKWNQQMVWGRAYLDSDNDPWIDLAVNLKGGVSAENFDDTVSWWWSVLRDFEDHIGWDKGK
jgi:hypothetical protein